MVKFQIQQGDCLNVLAEFRNIKTKLKSSILAACHLFGMVCAVALALLFGVLACSAQTGIYLFTGSETTITLNPGLYDITAYGAQGGGSSYFGSVGGLGVEMSGEFNFSASTTLTLLVGGAGADSFIGCCCCCGGGFYGDGDDGQDCGGGGSFFSGGSGGSASYLDGYYASGGYGGGGGYGGSGGGGSIIDSSEVAIITEISGIASPDDSPNGEIIITAVPVPEPTTLALTALSALSLLLFRRQRK